MKFLKKIALMAIFMLLVQSVIAVETGSAIKADEIRKEPFSDAKILGKLNSGDKVSIVKKDGGWLNVKSNKGNGWVRMLSIRRGAANKEKGSVESLKRLTSGRTGTGKVVATTGIRGLDEEELKAAKFDAMELRLAESYSTSREEAQNFAKQGKLKPLSLDYLPVPK